MIYIYLYIIGFLVVNNLAGNDDDNCNGGNANILFYAIQWVFYLYKSELSSEFKWLLKLTLNEIDIEFLASTLECGRISFIMSIDAIKNKRE